MTAAREVAEETGLVGIVQAPLDTIDIWFSVNEGGRSIRRHKLVHFYLLEYQHGTHRRTTTTRSTTRAGSPPRTRGRLTFPSERRVAEQALALLSEPDGHDREPSAAERSL